MLKVWYNIYVHIKNWKSKGESVIRVATIQDLTSGDKRRPETSLTRQQPESEEQLARRDRYQLLQVRASISSYRGDNIEEWRWEFGNTK